VVKVASLFGLLTAPGNVLPPEPVDTWHHQIRALRNATALWDAIAGEDAAALRRLLPQHQTAKGKELFRLAREHLARRVTETLGGRCFPRSTVRSDREYCSHACQMRAWRANNPK
jgi:hypothetical protein